MPLPPRKRRYPQDSKRVHKRQLIQRQPNRLSPSIVRIAGISCMPDQLFVKLKYAQPLKLSGTTTANNTFRANSCYDPDLTGTGHQPMGYDQWSNFYKRVRVHGAMFKYQFHNSGTKATTVYMYPSKDSTSALGTAAVEQAMAKTLVVAPATGSDLKTVTQYVDIRKFVGADINGSLDFSHNTGANPSTNLFMQIGCNITDETATAIAIDGLVEVVYYCEFFEREPLTQS